jgi:hypothetical protein
VIAGGLGGLGRSIASWLVTRGARNLILLSRSGPGGNENARGLISELQRNGVRVEALSCNIADLGSLQEVFDTFAFSMPPIKGCFQASMVLKVCKKKKNPATGPSFSTNIFKDTRFADMTFEEWKDSVAPKMAGSWNLHTVLPKNMHFFVFLSSATGIFGNVGQSNYAAGNTYQDMLARFRVSQGEKAISIDLGIVLGEGFVAENKTVMNYFQQLGIMLLFTLEEFFALLDFYCDPSLDILTPAHSQVITGLDLPSKILARGKEVPSSLYQPMFHAMHQISKVGKSTESRGETAVNYQSLFNSSSSLADAGLLVANALRKKLSRILGIAEGNIELNNRVESYGVDSLVAVELRNWLARDISADLAVFEILGGATLLAVGLTAASKSSYGQDAWTRN